MPQLARRPSPSIVMVVTALAALATAAAFIVLRRRRWHGNDDEEYAFDSRPAGLPSETSDATEARQLFEEYGVSLLLPEGWTAAVDELTAMGPQIAVIRIRPSEYATALPGELPNLSVIVEDVTQEQMTLAAYKEKSKEYAMMSSGSGLSMMAVDITKDGSVSIGPFQHTLEYMQMFPNVLGGGPLPCKFVNLMTLHKGIAYVLQYMARQSQFAEYFDTVMGIAKGLTIQDLPARPASRLVFCSQPHSLEVTVPTSWVLVRDNVTMGGCRTLVASFLAGSSTKPDSISLYTMGLPCTSASAMAEKYREVVKAPAEITPRNGDTAFFSYNADGKLIAVYCRKDFVLECQPEGQRVTHHSQPEEVVLAVLDKIQIAKGLTSSEFRYHNAQQRFSFALKPNGRLLEHKWGTSCVTYFPVPEEPDQAGPVFSVEVSTDEALADLQAVDKKLLASSDRNPLMKEKRIEVHRGREYLSFLLSSKEQSVWCSGQDLLSKIFITLRGSEQIILKWEAPAEDWMLYADRLENLLRSIDILP